MAFADGSKGYFAFDGSSNQNGTLTDYSSYITGVSLSETIDTDETTTFGDTAKQYIPALEDATIDIDALFDPTLDQGVNNAKRQTVRFEFAPQGTASGNVKYHGSFIVTSPDKDISLGSAGAMSFSAQITNGAKRATY